MVRQKMPPELATELKKRAAFTGADLGGVAATASLFNVELLGCRRA
jgi:hypothetical protein